MRALLSLTAALIVALGLTAASAGATEARSSSLGWVRAPGAEECIGTRALAEAVEARLGRQVFVSAARAEIAVEGQIERGPAGAWRAAISLAGEGGRVLGTRELRSEALSCRDLDAQLALVIAVMIDPDAALRAAPAKAITPAPIFAPAVIVQRELIHVPYVAPPRPDPWRAGLNVGVVFALGLLPNPGVGLALRGRVTPPRWPALELGATIWSTNQAESGGFGARFALVEGLVSACPFPIAALGFELGGCLGVRGGVIRVGGFGFDLAQVHERPTLAVAIEGRVRRRLVGPLVLALGPGLLVPIVRDRFYFSESQGQKLEVFRMSPLVGTLEATLGIEFPVTAFHNRAEPAPLMPVTRSPSPDPTFDAIARGGSRGARHRAGSRDAAPARRAEGVAFEQVFTENAPFVWRALRRLGVGEADVEDVCQEVFLVVHRQLAGFEARSSLRTWLYGICLRAASSYRRRPHRRREDIASTPPEEIVPAPQDDDLERKRALARLDLALDELDDDKRAVFVLYELEQLSMAEIAETTGCPLQTAYSRLHAARRLVQASLERAHQERASPS